MTIQRKLLLSFLGKAALVALVGGVSIYSLNATAKRLRLIVDTSLNEINQTNRESFTSAKIHAEIDAFQNAIDEHQPAKARTNQAHVDAAFTNLFIPIDELDKEAQYMLSMAKTTEDVKDEEQHISDLDHLRSLANSWKNSWQIAANDALKENKSNQHLFNPSDQAAHDIIAVSDELQNASTQEVVESLTESAVLARSQSITIFILSLAVIAITGLIALFVVMPIRRRLRAVGDKAAHFGLGDLSVRITLSGNDEIATLAGTFNHMADRLFASQQELIHTAQRAEAANSAKSNFLANMSHEIRTPMTAIMGYSELLLDPDQPSSERQESLQIIRRSSRHLLELINDVLDLSKIEADKMTVERVEMDLPQLTADVVSLMRPRTIAKGLPFQLSFADSIPSIIRSDPLRIKQVLMNILGNALKFTDRGEVRLHVASSPTQTSSIITFEISDTGIGLTQDQIALLFQPFTQADESTTRRFGGTGLGLTISKRFAEILGGNLTVDSLSGVGSKFRVTIDGGPLNPEKNLKCLTEAMLAPVAAEKTVACKISLKGNILLAEDGPDNQRLISLHLRKAGADVSIAANGRIALDMVKANKYDLILMDMQMPELDGYAATSELRSRGCKLPILALTAHAMSGDREKCIAAGCTDYLTKPIVKEHLLNTLASYLPGSEIVQLAPEAVAHITGANSSHNTPSLLRSSFSDDPDMKEAIQEFVADLPRRVTEINGFLVQANINDISRLVHQLKGAGGGYGFDQITRRATAAEDIIKQKAPFDLIKHEIDSLLVLVRSVQGYESAKEHANV